MAGVKPTGDGRAVGVLRSGFFVLFLLDEMVAVRQWPVGAAASLPPPLVRSGLQEKGKPVFHREALAWTWFRWRRFLMRCVNGSA